jgi:transcriptional regulator with XRE-family HTH domain
MKEKIVLNKFAQRLRKLRKAHKMSQEKLAEKADLSLTFIGYLERAEKNPTLTTLNKIAKALNMSPSELLVFPDDKRIRSSSSQTIAKAAELLEITLDMVEGHRRK